MEPRSPTHARILVRPVAEPGLITVGYPSPGSALGCAGHARGVAAFNLPARVGQLFGVSL
jgi:hypothetical protein